jgi:hypothetical protein
MAMIHISRSGGTLGVFDEARVREGLKTGEFIETDLGWTEGMPTWRPLSELETFSAQTPPPSPPPTGAQQSTPAAADMSPLVQPAAAQPAGLPWENREQLGFVNALFATIGMVLTRPSEAFAVMKRDAGIGDPLLYSFIMGTAGGLISFGFSVMIQSFGFMTGADGGVTAMLGLFGALFLVFLMPVFVVVGTFVAAGILHLCLMVVGGANRSFETTFRVIAYGAGSASVFQLVPVCGGMVTAVVAIVLYVIGLSRAHETDTGRALAAVLLPAVLCCGGGILLALIIPAMAALGGG